MPESEEPVAPPVPSATILIVRDMPNGMEVFMVKRHHQIDFIAGALVFPGGKAAKGDYDAGLSEFTRGAKDWTGEMRALGAAAIREAFEESGILFAREAGSDDFISSERLEALAHYRHRLEVGEIGLLHMLKKEHLVIACDALARFAHWITPPNMPKRFDTHFFIASAPPGHAGRHDGRESVDSVWITPAQAVADRTKWNVVFPTKLNLLKLAKSSNVADAMATARANPPLTVEPHVEQTPDGLYLKIREDAGYEQTSALMRDPLTPP
jgi:8-oxo-dGTP pyrophosphatase MutT (NUDIX family)